MQMGYPIRHCSLSVCACDSLAQTRCAGQGSLVQYVRAKCNPPRHRRAGWCWRYIHLRAFEFCLPAIVPRTAPRLESIPLGSSCRCPPIPWRPRWRFAAQFLRRRRCKSGGGEDGKLDYSTNPLPPIKSPQGTSLSQFARPWAINIVRVLLRKL